jgi:hypothetical protein
MTGTGRLARYALIASIGAVLLAATPACAAEPKAPTYQLVNATQFGRVASTRRTDAPTLEAALQLTLRDLAEYFGAAPSVRTAYQDSRTAGAGGASFVVTAWGIPAKGLIACRLERGAAHVAVAFIRADAPAAEWTRLTRPAPASSQGGAAGGGAKQAAPAALRPYRFPDGTGVVGLAPGWSTRASTAVHGVELQGPEGETVTLATSFAVQLPGSQLARMGGSFVAPFTSPVEALRILAPQLSQQSVMSGGPALQLDSLQVVEERKPMNPGGRCQVLTWGVTEQRRDGRRAHFKVMAVLDLSPIPPTSYMVMITKARAPDALYARDLPVMLQMTRSFQTDDARVGQVNQGELQDRQDWFKRQQEGHAEQERAFDAQHRGWERDQNLRARANDDFTEVFRGSRTVEDTTTGERASVDLGNVDRFVDDLNAQDPGRYRQIPLRDELDPRPAR